MLTSHYERVGRYYGSGGGGFGSQGTASEEEKRLTMILFSGIFDSLAQRVSCFYCVLIDFRAHCSRHEPQVSGQSI